MFRHLKSISQRKMSCLLQILTVYFVLLNQQTVFAADIQFDRIEMLNGTYLEGVYNISLFRIAKLNRTMHVFNAEMDFLTDVDQFHSMEFTFYYNRLNNNQYSKTLMRIPKQVLCRVLEKFRPFLSVLSETTTNFYQADGKSCPMKKVIRFANTHFFPNRMCFNWMLLQGHYYLRNLVIDNNKVPSVFASGNWKTEIIIYYKDLVALVVHAYWRNNTPQFN